MITPLVGHMDWFLRHGVWPDSSPSPGLWWSMVDLVTGKHPEGERAAGVSKRCYRWIESPHGSNLYWDGPLLVACHALSSRTGDERYAAAADRYATAYVAAATSPGGLWWWGNHYYVSASGEPVWFPGSLPPAPIRGDHDLAPLHETRPLPVPWPLLHRVSPAATLAALEAHRHHLSPKGGPGCFNRHADGAVGLAFLEAGGMLALAFAHQWGLTERPEAAELARAVLTFSWSTRDAGTGLMPANGTSPRWDYYQATSETGLWAGAAFAAADLLGEPQFADMAADAVGAWCDRAWCQREQKFHGRLNVASSDVNAGPKSTIYSPGTWCDLWDPLFPAHDYPLPMAEACVTAWERSSERRHLEAVQRWVTQIAESLPARNGLGGYAEHYGRVIHLLWRAGRVFSRPQWTELARAAAAEALTVLRCGPGLRSHPWEDRVDAVDGMGWLLLALLCLETDRESDLLGLFW